jgi:hypothetical protein
MKRVLTAISILLLAILTYSQSPGKMSYQAVIRNSDGELVKSTKIGMQISILQSSENGSAVYVETQSPTTNTNGLVSIVIGNGKVVTGNFTSIDWEKGTFFVKTETDLEGGSNYTITGISQLMGVPYAFHATTAESLTNPVVENDPKFSGWDKSTGIKIKESQITDLDHFTSADEKDPKYAADSALVRSGIRSWNKSLAKTIDAADTSRWGKAENDPVFKAWDKSTGIKIKESQITDLDHFTTDDETDPVFKRSVAKGITSADTAKWNKKTGSGFSGNYQDLTNKPTDLSDFTNDVGYQRTIDDGDINSTNEIQELSYNTSTKTIGLSKSAPTVHIPDVEGDPRYAADSSYIKSGTRSWNSSLAKTIDASDTTHWGRAETDPVFRAWDKSTGITISESQIADLDHFTTADEIDPRYAADSSYIKSGTRSWNSSLAKTIDASDTTHWGRAETDPVFRAWDKSTGITISESQIADLDHFTTADEIDPRYAADSSYIKSGTRSWNSSLAKTIDAADTTHWGRAETDPYFNAWDKHTGITVTESQITDLDHFTTADEIDPRYAADSSYIKSGTRSWNSSLAKTIDASDTTHWGRAETDPVFVAWDKHTGITVTESQITDLDHFTTADEIDPRYTADSSYIKSGTRSWDSSLAKTIDATDTTHWGREETDPVFDAWDKSTGIVITESQISDLDHFTNSDETDQVYSADSSYIKTAVRSWDSSLAKTIDAADTTRWGQVNSFDGNYSSLTNAPDIAVSTANKNITLTSAQTFSVKDATNTYLRVNQSTGYTGIGSNATSPRAQLEVGGTDGLLVTGTANTGTVRALGAGIRMHWYPRKGAFRVGMAETTYWDDDGSTMPRLALYSVGMGYQVRATATASNAIGPYNWATGDYALSMGSYSRATASHAVAIGTQAYASGIYSFAFGSGADTNGRDGSMVFGDDAYFQTAYSSADNQLTMRFIGGYRLWTTYPDSTAGVYMRHGQSGWSNYCDRNMKENFKKLNYEEVLKKIDEQVPITEWNYKKTDTASRYIGPMAQDFYNAFKLGGDDSLGINSINEMGVSMAAIHGLIDRTDSLKAAVEELKLEKQKNALLQAMFQEQNGLLLQMRKELDEMKAEVSKYAIKEKKITTEPQADNNTH